VIFDNPEVARDAGRRSLLHESEGRQGRSIGDAPVGYEKYGEFRICLPRCNGGVYGLQEL